MDGATGEIVEDRDQRLHDLEEQLAQAERDLRTKRRQIASLQRDRQRERESYERREIIEKIFGFWQRKTKHPRSKLTPERFDAVRSMLEAGYTARELCLAVAGAAFDPFTKPAKNGRLIAFNDLELICRSGKNVEAYANRAPKGYKRKAPASLLTPRPGSSRMGSGDETRGDHSGLPGVAQDAPEIAQSDIADRDRKC